MPIKFNRAGLVWELVWRSGRRPNEDRSACEYEPSIIITSLLDPIGTTCSVQGARSANRTRAEMTQILRVLACRHINEWDGMSERPGSLGHRDLKRYRRVFTTYPRC